MQFPVPTPAWITEGLKYTGLKEIHGPQTNSTIRNWLIKLKAWWTDDETPWCGVFVAHCLQTAGIGLPKYWMRAKAYADFGQACNRDSIPFGAICVKSRVGGGHVFFAVARSRDGAFVYGLGGNQGDQVCIETFRIGSIDAVRWPDSLTLRLSMPVVESAAEVNAAKEGGSES